MLEKGRRARTKKNVRCTMQYRETDGKKDKQSRRKDSCKIDVESVGDKGGGLAGQDKVEE